MSTTPVKPESVHTNLVRPGGHRIDVKLHNVLMDEAGPNRPNEKTVGVPILEPEKEGFPEPIYPQRAYSEETDATLTEYQRMNALRTWTAWAKPYFASRSLKDRKELRPIIAYLFTDYKCNLDCHYCWPRISMRRGVGIHASRSR